MTTACDLPIDLSTKSQHHGHNHHHHGRHHHNHHHHHLTSAQHQLNLNLNLNLSNHLNHLNHSHLHHHQLHHHLDHEQLQQLQLEYLSHQQLSVALANYPLNRIYAPTHQHPAHPLHSHHPHHLHQLERIEQFQLAAAAAASAGPGSIGSSDLHLNSSSSPSPPLSSSSISGSQQLSQHHHHLLQQQQQQQQQQLLHSAQGHSHLQLSQQLAHRHQLQLVAAAASDHHQNHQNPLSQYHLLGHPSNLPLHHHHNLQSLSHLRDLSQLANSTASLASSNSSSSSSASSVSSSSNEAASPEAQDGPLDATVGQHQHQHQHQHQDHDHDHNHHHHDHQSSEQSIAHQQKQHLEILNSHVRNGAGDHQLPLHFHARHQQAQFGQAESPPAHRLNQQLSLHNPLNGQAAEPVHQSDNPSPIDLHRSSTSSTVSTISSPSSSSASITSTSSSLNLQLNDKKRINRPLTDELIRQVTVGCIEQGLLLFRIRNEMRSTLSAYRRLYESAVAYGLNKALDAKLEQLSADSNDPKVDELQERGKLAGANEEADGEDFKTKEAAKDLGATEMRLKEYYEGELAKRDGVISHQRSIIRALNQK